MTSSSAIDNDFEELMQSSIRWDPLRDGSGGPRADTEGTLEDSQLDARVALLRIRHGHPGQQDGLPQVGASAPLRDHLDHSDAVISTFS